MLAENAGSAAYWLVPRDPKITDDISEWFSSHFIRVQNMFLCFSCIESPKILRFPSPSSWVDTTKYLYLNVFKVSHFSCLPKIFYLNNTKRSYINILKYIIIS